jgi:predicted dehydrogenase
MNEDTNPSNKNNRLPRLGFLGTGWIGRHRWSVLRTGGAEIASVCDSSPECVAAVVKTHPGIAIAESLDELLDGGLDGIVIATPSAMHAEQSVRVLQSNLAAAVGTIHSVGVNLYCL